METQERTIAYELFAQSRAEQTGQTENEIQAIISPSDFEALVRDLHHRWINGEFSFGRFTELIGIPHWELWEILDVMQLPIHR